MRGNGTFNFLSNSIYKSTRRHAKHTPHARTSIVSQYRELVVLALFIVES